MNATDDLPLCTDCGTQYPKPRELCPVCEDPRASVSPPGQEWTTLRALRQDRHNVFKQDTTNPHIWSIYTEPRFAIGQRCILLDTPAGLVLWDLIPFLDEETEAFIKSKGKLAAIVISHPHFYSTNSVWAEVFDCSVYVASEDKEWLVTRPREEGKLRWVEEVNTRIVDGVTAIKCGGHFDGSMCLHWDGNLFHADTIFSTPLSRNPPKHRNAETPAFAFMWSIPNMIPLDPKTIYQIWSRLKPFDFEASFGNIPHMDARDKNLKQRLLVSAKMQVTKMGWAGKHEGDLVFNETLA